MAWPGFGSIRFDSIMGQQKPYNDESGAFGGKRFTTGTVPTWEEQYRPHQSQEEAQPNPWSPQSDRQTEGGSYYDELERIRGSRGPALTAYQKALGEQPTWEQHKPDWKRRLAGALISGAVAAGGDDSGTAVALGRSVVRAPYDTARSEYANRMKNLGASAKLEQDEVEAQLQSLKEARALGLKYDEYRLKALENEQRRRHDEATLGVSRFTAETGRLTQEQTGRHYQNQDVNAAHTGGVNERNVDSQISNRTEQQKIDRERIAAGLQEAMIRAGSRRGNPPSPAEQQTAIDNATRQLALDPRFRDLVDLETDPKIPQLKPDDKSPRYQAAMRALIEITKRQLEEGTPFGDAPTIGTIPVRPGGGGGAGW